MSRLHYTYAEYLRDLEDSSIKLEFCIPSLHAVLFVSHKRREITVVSRARRGWSEKIFRSGESVIIDDPAASIEVDDFYDGVVLDD